MNLLFTMWVTFHLFCFAVLHKNLKKLEVLYVVTSLLVPAVIASVPLTMLSYSSITNGTICNIYSNNGVAFTVRLALWDGPAMFILLVASGAMVFMISKLSCGHQKFTEGGDQFKKAINRLLPLAAFPFLFFIFEIPVLVLHIYITKGPTVKEGVILSAVVFFSFWSMASGTTLIIHIFVANCHVRKHKKLEMRVDFTVGNPTANLYNEPPSACSATNFSLPPASV